MNDIQMWLVETCRNLEKEVIGRYEIVYKRTYFKFCWILDECPIMDRDHRRIVTVEKGTKTEGTSNNGKRRETSSDGQGMRNLAGLQVWVRQVQVQVVIFTPAPDPHL